MVNEQQNEQQTGVTEQALVQRLRRALKKDADRLVKNRRQWTGNLGEYYLVDGYRNIVLDPDVDLVALGREIGVLRPHERLVEEV